ncbi:MAG TPA: alpha-glucosidase [Acholeplasmataceae bacterium]|jgi:oligo-1,6-glucosidase|nr:alpha-glucosidase [Acholeplasmataceae bacterium]
MRWYKESIVYQIYPRSFNDFNGDGIGDIRGIIEKLDYLKGLGVNTVWLSPIYDSPLDDMGYDISNYYDIHKDYGTLDDFKEMLSKMHERGIKLIMDLVVNHTSDEHPWFLEAKKSVDSPYHEYYIFRKGKNGKKPNNWKSFFGGSAWEYNEETDEYFLHLFSKRQPDLNWENPKVREEVKNILRFWLDLGVDGFRCDVINLLSKKEGLPNAKGLPILGARGIYIDGPKMHDYLQELKRDVFSKYDMFTVGECVLINSKTALSYIEEGIDELNMVFHFEHMNADCFYTKWLPRKFKLRRLKKPLSKWQYDLGDKGWNSLFLENHDQPRSIDRFGSLEYRNESAKMLATYIFSQKGTPYIYQGEEIGMTNAHYTTIEQYKDVETLNMYKTLRRFFSEKKTMKMVQRASRDNSRTPMQWNQNKNAGFSEGEPWLEVNPNYKDINVSDSIKDEDSILNYYKKYIALRKKHPVFVFGDYREHYPKSNKLAYYERNYQGKKLLVICNFTSKELKFNPIYDLSKYKLILNNYQEDEKHLLPYQAKIYLGES